MKNRNFLIRLSLACIWALPISCLADIPASVSSLIEKPNPTEADLNQLAQEVSVWAKNDPSAATRWAYGIKRQRGDQDIVAFAATQGVFRAVSRLEPEGAFKWIQQSLKSQSEREDAILGIMQEGAFKDVPLVSIAKAGGIFGINSFEHATIINAFMSKIPRDQSSELQKYCDSLPSGVSKNILSMWIEKNSGG